MYGTVDKLSMMKKQQIDSLKIFNEKVTEVKEGCEYKVDFQSNGRSLCVTVILSNEFPLDKPTLKVDPIILHPWVGHSGKIIAAPGLLKFTVHSELGRVVQAIIREFELRPPPILNEDQPLRINSLQNSDSAGTSNGSSPTLTMLMGMPTSRLVELQNNPDKLEELISSLPAVSTLTKSVDELLSYIENLASENISRESEMASLRLEVASLTTSLMSEMDQYQKLNSQYTKLCEKYSPDSIKECLQDSVFRIDEDSEKVAESFLIGEIDLDNFLSEYTKYRALSHSRKLRSENLGYQLNKFHEAGF